MGMHMNFESKYEITSRQVYGSRGAVTQSAVLLSGLGQRVYVLNQCPSLMSLENASLLLQAAG